jgi:hypothetical protein
VTGAPSAGRLSASAAGWLLVLVAVGVSSGLFLAWPPIPQDPAYHDFADRRTLLGIPHAGDVLGNAALVLAGLVGLRAVRRAVPAGLAAGDALAQRVAFLGVFLTGFGSAWYHWRPDASSLLWDRLPMALTSGALLSIVVAEFVSSRAGRLLLLPAVGVALGSVISWHLGESRGAGDLRAYGIVQFLPALALVLMLTLARSRYACSLGWWGVLAWFAASKTAEALDRPIYELTGLVSGHNAKHVLAGVAVWAWSRMLVRRASAPAAGPDTSRRVSRPT